MSADRPDATPNQPPPVPPPPPGTGQDADTRLDPAARPGLDPAARPGLDPAARPGLDPAARPGLDNRERQLDPRIVQVWRLFGTLGWLFPLGVPTVLLFVFTDPWGWVALGITLVILVSSATWYPRLRYRRWHWQLTDLALELRYGVLFTTEESVPYFRIQQIDISQGPVDRLLNLSTLQVTTASASGSAVLPGIPADEAPTVRAELLARASEAVAAHEGDLRDAV